MRSTGVVLTRRLGRRRTLLSLGAASKYRWCLGFACLLFFYSLDSVCPIYETFQELFSFYSCWLHPRLSHFQNQLCDLLCLHQYIMHIFGCPILHHSHVVWFCFSTIKTFDQHMIGHNQCSLFDRQHKILYRPEWDLLVLSIVMPKFLGITVTLGTALVIFFLTEEMDDSISNRENYFLPWDFNI